MFKNNVKILGIKSTKNNKKKLPKAQFFSTLLCVLEKIFELWGNEFSNMNVGFISLGCSKNLIDTETIIGIFKKNKFTIVNDETVPINYQLKNKDRVRIITDNLSFSPRENWIDIVQTIHAKKKIKEFN